MRSSRATCSSNPNCPPASDLADRTVAAGTRLTAQLEARLLDDIQTKDRRPSFAAKSMLWLICLWFPFIQPALEGFLHMTAEGGPIDIARGALTIVTALSASHLLASFGVVAAIFVMILAGMYVRALRAVRRAREATDTTSPIRDAVDELMIHEIVLPLIRPFDDRLGKTDHDTHAPGSVTRSRIPRPHAVSTRGPRPEPRPQCC